ncbi:ATP-grasp domain-containing protein [Chytriomyces sp. MP71]|nr:ATP-grasp domain-containing protein [Chytriomyces sp. MP71]
MMTRNILILHDTGGPSLTSQPSFSKFISTSDGVRLLIISSKVSEADKVGALAYAEIASPCTTGALEIAAWEFHKLHTIHEIYTQQEDLILRAAQLRVLFGISVESLHPSAALCFRDKVLMKERVAAAGFNIPKFARVWSPANVIQFINEFGYPVVVKPSLGSASASVTVLRSDLDRNRYLTSEFYSRIDDAGKCMDYSGDIIIESFAKGSMVHVNGYAHFGKLEIAWPFKYINTNLSFTSGSAYGNVLIPANTPHHTALLSAAQRVLESLPCPQHLSFHLELFEQQDEKTGAFSYTLCEIAARRPGGSIGNLIERCESGSTSLIGAYTPNFLFVEMDFRCAIGLPLRHNRATVSRYARGDPGFSVADLIVPLRKGILVRVPEVAECPIPNVQIVQIAKTGTVYQGFNINTMNTCVRLVAVSQEQESVTEQDMEQRLRRAEEWYQSQVIYS